MSPVAGLDGQVVALIAVVAAGGAATIGAAIAQWEDESLAPLAALAVFAAVAEWFDVRLARQSRLSVSVAAVLAAGTLAGLPGIMVVALSSALADYLLRSKLYYKGVFNAGTLLLAGAAYVGAFQSFPVGGDGRAWPTVLYPALLGTMANFLVNTGLVALVVALNSGHRLITVWRENFLALPPYYLVLGSLAAMMASAYHLEGLPALMVASVPLAMMGYLISRFLATSPASALPASAPPSSERQQASQG